MVKLLMGHKGSGKTKQMIQLANDKIQVSDGSVIFINKNQRRMLDLQHQIRVISMDEFEHITNSDEYIGFIYGIISSDYDIESMFIDSILKHADVTLEDMPEFVERLKTISDDYKVEFIVSLSAEKAELAGVNFDDCEILN